MIKRFKIFYRFLFIHWVLAKHGLEEFVLALPILAPLHFLAHLNPWNWFRDAHQTRGERLRLALIELGPIFVKFGQMLSTRADIVPEDILDELAELQDQVPPFSSDLVLSNLEKIYGQPVDEVFAEFSYVPLASASIAQVHTAILHTGEEVVVKILRPNIEKQILSDIALMEVMAKLTERYWSQGARLRPREVVAEFFRTLQDELDLQREAANASQLKRNFLGSMQIYIPKVYWEYTHPGVLVIERIYGVNISNLTLLKEKKVNLKRLAENGVEIFFTQVFRDCFFHADMHPGNVFVNISDPDYPVYTAIDFGIMGTLNPKDQRYLAENFLAFFKRDYRRVAELHVESGWVNSHTRIDVFESAIRTVCEPMFERPLKEISCARVLLKLFETAHLFEMEIQPQLLLLQKTLLNIEGLGKQLYPDLDLWHSARPFLEQWIRKKIGLRALLKKLVLQGPYWLEKLPDLPPLLYENLYQEKWDRMNAKKTYTQQFKERRKDQRLRFKAICSGVGITLSLGSFAIWLYEFTPLKVFLNKTTLKEFSIAGLVSGLFLLFKGKKPNL